MRIVLETVERGSSWWSTGTVAVDKAVPLSLKFAELYQTDLTPAQRTAVRAKGRASAQLLLWPVDVTCFRWWLLASDGRGLVHEREKLQHAHRSGERVTFGDQYKLVHRQRQREAGGGKRWTWAMTPQRFEQHLKMIRQLSRSHGPGSGVGDRLLTYLDAVKRMPGYAGIREQKLELQQAGREAWQRTHRADQAFPWTERIPYLTKSFACYHAPEPLRLDTLANMMQREAAARGAAAAATAAGFLDAFGQDAGGEPVAPMDEVADPV
ncbi:hypothetical protein [Rivibacter subsaxonicus]|nr:hypothetical protein [Rivibacter subsaxonicus]